MIPEWCSGYVGLPFVEKGRNRAGCDCWGLIVLIYREQLGIELPLHDNDYTKTTDAESVSVTCRKEAAMWRQVEKPKAFDPVLLRIRGIPWHVGIVVAEGFMLHCDPKADTVLENYMRPIWAPRIEGFYRHESRS